MHASPKIWCTMGEKAFFALEWLQYSASTGNASCSPRFVLKTCPQAKKTFFPPLVHNILNNLMIDLQHLYVLLDLFCALKLLFVVCLRVRWIFRWFVKFCFKLVLYGQYLQNKSGSFPQNFTWYLNKKRLMNSFLHNKHIEGCFGGSHWYFRW